MMHNLFSNEIFTRQRIEAYPKKRTQDTPHLQFFLIIGLVRCKVFDKRLFIVVCVGAANLLSS